MEESWSSGGGPLLRTRSLPLVLEASGGVPARQTKLDPRQLLTLTRHYYPEGGWGWGVAVAATIAQLLAHGLHQASAVIAVEAIKRFGPEVQMQAGMCIVTRRAVHCTAEKVLYRGHTKCFELFY
ncbi:unnamed protein product [Pieris brassicae]|uniref:Uncharacterized protein n=1 Tax=Pieris brassicae TaxID=7116 RepID=A0A9P0TRA3_PIEBR|nr:unnamed protein product [Pieris brassicae]